MSFSTVQMVMWLEVMFDEMNCLFQNHWTHILPGPIHWCKICLKVSPWDTDSLRTNDRNLCQRVVVVCCGQVKPPKTFKNYAMFNMLKGEFVHFFSSWQCVASLTNVYMLLLCTILYSIILKFDKDLVQSWDYTVPHMIVYVGYTTSSSLVTCWYVEGLGIRSGSDVDVEMRCQNLAMCCRPPLITKHMKNVCICWRMFCDTYWKYTPRVLILRCNLMNTVVYLFLFWCFYRFLPFTLFSSKSSYKKFTRTLTRG